MWTENQSWVKDDFQNFKLIPINSINQSGHAVRIRNTYNALSPRNLLVKSGFKNMNNRGRPLSGTWIRVNTMSQYWRWRSAEGRLAVMAASCKKKSIWIHCQPQTNVISVVMRTIWANSAMSSIYMFFFDHSTNTSIFSVATRATICRRLMALLV